MERDILKGRQHMNLSHWDELTPDKQEALMAEIVQQARTRSMPLLQYRLIHWNARITDADVKTLQTWAHGSSPGEGAGTRGTSLLAGVYGRAAGSTPQFSYSEALKKAHITWTDDSLERWLADPDTYVPRNDMEFAVRKPDERRNLIAYLKQLPTK
jgi:cytochrome c